MSWPAYGIKRHKEREPWLTKPKRNATSGYSTKRLVGDRLTPDPELEYHLTRLTSALSAGSLLSHRYLSAHYHRAALLAEIDTLLVRMGEIRELAERVREVLLQPPPEKKPEGRE
jgi:hypothetical protein